MKNIVVLISGKQGSGKTTLSENLFIRFITMHSLVDVSRLKFADPLYDIHTQIHEVMARYGENFTGVDGKLLQLLGTEWGRNHIRKSLWVDVARRRIQKIIAMDDFIRKYRVMIIDDSRFPDELTAFDDLCTTIKVRLEADEPTRKKRALKWRDNTTHPSEIALDVYKNWDIIIRSDEYSADEICEITMEAIVNKANL